MKKRASGDTVSLSVNADVYRHFAAYSKLRGIRVGRAAEYALTAAVDEDQARKWLADFIALAPKSTLTHDLARGPSCRAADPSFFR